MLLLDELKRAVDERYRVSDLVGDLGDGDLLFLNDFFQSKNTFLR
jgi:hypothetical protein